MTILKTITLTLAIGLSIHCYSSNTKPHLNYELLDIIDQEVRAGEYGKITSLLILNSKGATVHERYYGFSSKTTLNPISSVTKSITSILVGIGLEQGFLKSIDSPVWTYYPEYSPVFNRDTAKKAITIRHLLNQTSGLKWEEWKYPYNYASNSLIALLETESNWVETFFNLPMEANPGTTFCYNSLGSQVIAETLSRVSGLTFEMLTQKYLFEPLSINTYFWDKYPLNSAPAWGGIALTTHDMAKLGLVVLNGGLFREKPIVSKDWINISTSKLIDYKKQTGYGLHWWIDEQPNNSPLIYAAGYGDQYVYIVPSKQLVIAINAQNFADYQWPKSIKTLVNSVIASIN
ncbi:MAG: serine hydrolase [Bacteroidales bacterium]|nr:serine hydrolase [Bacteroidales bacterium]